MALYKITFAGVAYVEADDKEEAEILFFDNDTIASEYEPRSIEEVNHIIFGDY